jgi:UDP-N-acetylglucosamine 2-epimerase
LFCPTPLALENLRKENLAQRSLLVGDVMFDLFKVFQERVNEAPAVFKRFGLTSKGYHLLTIHREVNTTDKDLFKRLIAFVSDQSGGAPVLFLVHPRTKSLAMQLPDNFMVSPPQGYKDMVYLTSNAHTVFTDSGGLQKEACFARVPCITLYYETTWEETIQSGWNVLWEKIDERAPDSSDLCDYGDGHACEKIHEHLRRFYGD